MFDNLTLKAKLFVSNGIIIGLTIMISLIVYSSINSLLDTVKWVNHTNTVITKATQVQAAAVNMETGMRGYLLAGDKKFLEPYQQGDELFNQLISELAVTVNDNPTQVRLLTETESTINQWHNEITNPYIALRGDISQAKSMNHIAKLVQKKQGKTYFDRFRDQIQTFIDVEQKLLIEREAEVQKTKSLARSKELNEWVIHTYKVISMANQIISSAVDMETGMRGYLLAGQEAFLEPYHSGQITFSQLIDTLSQTVNDNPPQVRLLGEIKHTINQWRINVVEPQITLRREIGSAKTMDDLATEIAQAKGKVFFDKFRQQISIFKERENVLMSERLAALHSPQVLPLTSPYLARF